MSERMAQGNFTRANTHLNLEANAHTNPNPNPDPDPNPDPNPNRNSPDSRWRSERTTPSGCAPNRDVGEISSD